MHFSLPMTFSTQTLIFIGVGLVVLFLLLLALAGRLARRRPTRRARGYARRTTTRSKRRDHGAEVASRHGKARSPEWHRVEKEHLLHEPACAACGYQGPGLQVHHIKPFHLHPSLELDPTNLITLCEIRGRDHHLLLGHLDEWESYNPNVRSDVKHFYGKSAEQIRSSSAWQKAVAKRPGLVKR
jgi:5-methylcytosine-specific restriction endonuclease McrA